MNIHEFNRRLSGLSSRTSSNMKSVLFEQALLVRHELQARSPVDRGVFRSSWVLSRMAGSSSSLSVAIKNPTSYGHWLDEGAEVKGPPWFFPKTNVKPTGKLIVKNGMVWAGGLSPSGFVIGGISTVVVSNRKLQMQFVNAVADAFIGSL